MTSQAHIPTYHYSQMTWTEPPEPLLGPSNLATSPTPLAPLPPPLASTIGTATAIENPLYLSVDSGVRRVKACVLDKDLKVVWTDQVELDTDLAEYGTRDGVYTCGDSVTCPSIVRLHALDLVLTKISRDCPDPTLLSRVVCVSGAGQPNALHYLAPNFLHTLRAMPLSATLSLPELFTPIPPSEPVFSVYEPTTDGDATTNDCIQALEQRFGQEQYDTSTEPDYTGVGAVPRSRRNSNVLDRGRDELARRTGGTPCLRSAVAQLMQTLRSDELRREESTKRSKKDKPLLDRTERIVLESGLLASVFLGRIAPMDESDACTTGMLNALTAEWDQDILEFVASQGGANGDRLEAVLGKVGSDGGKALGTISMYFVDRFGFSPDCLVSPFIGAEASLSLVYPLSRSNGDVLVSLSRVAETDSLIASVPDGQYVPSQDWAMIRNPARASWQPEADDAVTQQRSEDEDPAFLAVVQNRDAGTGRMLVREIYCNSRWDVFQHLASITPHGGTLGVDEKYYAYFFPHREIKPAQAVVRFVAGARVREFTDRKVNPRLLIESQALLLRVGLGRLLRSMQPPHERAQDGVRPFDAAGFAPLSPASHPKRVIVVGGAAVNSPFVFILSSVFGAPAYTPAPLGSTESSHDKPSTTFGQAGKPSAVALGAAYKAAWTYERETTKNRIGFQRFLRRALEAVPTQTTAEQKRSKHESKRSITSYAGTLATSSSVSGPPPSLLSLGGPNLSHVSTASLLQAPGPGQGASNGGAKTFKLAYGVRDEHVLADEADQLSRLGPNPPGLELVAIPDADEHKYYASMIPEHVRLKRYALSGAL